MCVVSMIGDYARDYIPGKYPWINPMLPFYPNPLGPGTAPMSPQPMQWPPAAMDTVPRAEFDKLKAEVEALKQLLVAAQKYDKAIGLPDCEQAEKVELLRKIASLVGVDLSDVLKD